MPIINVEIVTRPAETLPSFLAKQLADALGNVMGSEPRGTWVRLHSLPADRYAEGPGEESPFFPVFVTILRARLPAADVLQDEVTRIAEVTARLCDRPAANVHVQYLPPALGRVAFGGRLLDG